MGVTHYDGRLFITMPRRRTGIPATLNYIDLTSKTNGMSPLLRGYPSYQMNTLEVSLDNSEYTFGTSFSCKNRVEKKRRGVSRAIITV